MEEAGRAPASSVLASPKARLHAVGCAALKVPPVSRTAWMSNPSMKLRRSGCRACTVCEQTVSKSRHWRVIPPVLLGGFDNWCGRGDSNPHGLATASPSSWCVCQFRHFRVERSIQYINAAGRQRFEYNSVTHVGGSGSSLKLMLIPWLFIHRQSHVLPQRVTNVSRVW